MTQAQYRDYWTQREAQAVNDCGLTHDEFYGMQPRQFKVYVDHAKARRQQEQYMLSQLMAITANFSVCRPKEPFQPTDFMIEPLEGKRQQPVEQPKMTARRRKSVASTLRSIFLGGMLGEVKHGG